LGASDPKPGTVGGALPSKVKSAVFLPTGSGCPTPRTSIADMMLSEPPWPGPRPNTVSQFAPPSVVSCTSLPAVIRWPGFDGSIVNGVMNW
jgi:hypothetical protein